MKKLSPIIIFLLILTTAVQKDSDRIEWSPTQQLTWADFKGKIDKSSPYEAMTYTTIEIQSMQLDEKQMEYTITNSFEKKLSWSKDKKSVGLLKHEQLHFDITELVVRKMKKKLLSKKFKNIKEIQNFARDAFGEGEKERKRLNSLYDKETDHSINKEKQKEWEDKIEAELGEFNEYSAALLVLKAD
jgi:hypothetical protein